MPPAVAHAKLTLSYPLYASDFDQQNADFLLVGGGGGEGRTGVSNKITLINASRKQTISEVVDIDLSKDEDSVTSLAVASSTESSVTAFAGINSSQKDQNAGKNEHLRSFRLEYPPKRRIDGSTGEEKGAQEYKGQTAPLGRASLFTPSVATRKETFQRITRLSRPCKINGGQLGAISTGLAPEGEIILFDAKTNGPMGPWVEARLPLGKGVEAADIDIIGLNNTDDGQDTPPGSFSVAYCTDYDVQMCKMTLKQTTKPELISAYTEPHPDTFAKKDRPKFRSLRFLTPNLLLLLQNRPDRQGADLLLLELSPNSQGRILGRKRLHKGIKAATALSVTHLSSTVSSNSTQHAIAVAGQDISISIFTLEHPLRPPFKGLKFHLHTILRSVHPLQITSLSFSTFLPPQTPQSSTPPQYIKLASTSIANTVIVHTLPLIPYPPPSQKSPKQRYVLTSPGRSDATQFTLSLLISTFAIALGAFLLQAFTEIRGGSPEYLGAKGWLSQNLHDRFAIPYVLENQMNTASTAISSLVDQATLSTSSLKTEATDAASDIKEALTNTPQQAKEAVSSALDAASSAAAELKQASDAYSSTASSSATSAVPSTAYHHIRDLLSRHHRHRREESAQGIPHMIIQHHEDDSAQGKLKAGFHH
ncbi:MAG: hypothetical protein Q9222_007388, partial [Ikaeria aurantiellina]